MAEKFGVLPSQIDKEDADDILQAFQLLNRSDKLASERTVTD